MKNNGYICLKQLNFKNMKRFELLFLLLLTIGCNSFRLSDLGSDDFSNRSVIIENSLHDSIVDYFGHRYALTRCSYLPENIQRLCSDGSLSPTHCALCIYPESMDELHDLEKDKSIIMFYHPFGYELQPESLDEDNTTDATELFLDGNCGFFSEGNDSRILRPVYVLWPKSCAIPDSIHYDFLFESHYSEMIIDRSFDIEPDSGISGYLYSFDNRSSQYSPIKNVQLEFQSIFHFTRIAYTDSTGFFFLPYADSDHPLVINLKNDKFSVRDSLTSSIKSLSVPLYDDIYNFPSNNCENIINLPANFYLDVYKAAEYYFNGSNDLLSIVPTYDTLGTSIDIHAIDNASEDNYLGCFYNNPNPYICIWNPYKNNYSGASSKLFGTVNHELGHATNRASTGRINMNNTEPVIKESFASFFGWYNVLQYYAALIGSNQNMVNSICTQGRQYWTPSSQNINYTPIFIDLFDNYNQHTYSGSPYNEDVISNVPITFILSASLGPLQFQSVYNTLISGVGVLYSADDFSSFISPYSLFLP